jgi:integrase
MRGSRFAAGAFRFFEGKHVQHSRYKRRGQMIQRGDRKWLLRVFLGRDAQGRKKYASKTVTGTTAQAQQELTKLLRESDTRSLVRPTRQTLAEYVEQWYNTKVQVSESTLSGYRLQLGLYILPHLGHLRLHEITPLAVQDTITKLRNQGLAPRTIQYAHAVLHQALKKAVKLGFLAKNPTEDTELPSKTRRAFTILSPEQMVTLFESEKDKRLYPLWLLLLNTGLRPGEAMALKWGDLKGDTLQIQRVLVRKPNGAYHVVEQKAKTEESLRAVTLSRCVVETLKEQRARQVEEMLAYGQRYVREDFVFATRFGSFVDPNNVRNRWKSALKRAGLPANVRLYDTRHSHATALLNDGNVNLAWVSARLGHSSVKTTEAVYTRVLPEAHRAMAGIMESVWEHAKQRKAARA